MKKSISFIFLLVIITSCSTQKKVTNIPSFVSQPTPCAKNDSTPILVESTLVKDSIEIPIDLTLNKHKSMQNTSLLTEKKKDDLITNISNEKSSFCGHIDMARVLTNMEDYKLASHHMDSLQKYLSQQYELMIQEFQRKDTEYSADTISLPMVRQMRQQELQSLADRIKFFQEMSQEQLEQEESKLLTPIYEKLRNATRQISDDKKLLFVFEKRYVLYSSDNAIDITDDVIQKLK